jgi:hypothetical protein
VPGHWAQADDGWRWVSGFWALDTQQEVNYLDAPPASLENGPSVLASDDESVYVPGLWVYRSERYRWRPGFWLNCRPGWTWCTSHYQWTPRGCVYVDGYWDYPLEDRGCLFAPVCFEQRLWETPDWRYRPRCVVSIGGLLESLFVRPSCHQY